MVEEFTGKAGVVKDSVLPPVPTAVTNPVVGFVLCCQVYVTPDTALFTLVAVSVVLLPAQTVPVQLTVTVGLELTLIKTV